MAITEEFLTRSGVEGCLEALATLRIDIFREYPYLYDGLREDELKYLRLYGQTPGSFVISVSDSGRMVGAATGIPLRYEKGMIDPFSGTTYPVDEIFYVGEVLFYPEYRNSGLGQRLLKHIEEYVRSHGNYRYLTCATVVRPESHELQPKSYISIDRFLNRTGFIKLPGITTSFDWKEIDGVSRNHPMQFWIKDLC